MGSSSHGGGSLRGILSGNVRTSSVGRSRILACPRENDYRLCVVEHVGDQGTSGKVVSRNITVPPASENA